MKISVLSIDDKVMVKFCDSHSQCYYGLLPIFIIRKILNFSGRLVKIKL